MRGCEMTKEAMQQALEALSAELWMMLDKPVDEQYRVRYAYLLRVITALREALAQPEQQAEPVAWMFEHSETGRMNYVSNDGRNTPDLFLKTNLRYALVCPLYAAPPQRPWVGLTDNDWGWVADRKGTSLDTFDQGAAWAQQRLKEHNK